MAHEGGHAADKDFEEDFESLSDENEDSPAATAQPSTLQSGAAAGKASAAGGQPVPVPVPVPKISIPGAAAAAAAGGGAGGVAHPAGVQQTQAEEAVAKALESGMWRQQLDPGTQKHYYYHVITKRTTWDLAAELGFGATAVASRTRAASLSSHDSLSDAGPPMLKLPDKVLARARGNPVMDDARAGAAAVASADSDDARLKSPAMKSDTAESLMSDDDLPPAIRRAGGGAAGGNPAAFGNFVAFEMDASSTPRDGDPDRDVRDDGDGHGSSSGTHPRERQSKLSVSVGSGSRGSLDGSRLLDTKSPDGSPKPGAARPPLASLPAASGTTGGDNSHRGSGAYSGPTSEATLGKRKSEEISAARPEQQPARGSPSKSDGGSSSMFSTASQAVALVEEKKREELARIAEQAKREREEAAAAAARLAEEAQRSRFLPATKGTSGVNAYTGGSGSLAPSAAPPMPTAFAADFTAPTSGQPPVPAPGAANVRVESGGISANTLISTVSQVGAAHAQRGVVAHADAARSTELRDTTDAIERLVRAYATLRAPPPSGAVMGGGDSRASWTERRHTRHVDATETAQQVYGLRSGRSGVLLGGDVDNFFDGAASFSPADDFARTRVQQVRAREPWNNSSGQPSASVLQEVSRLGANEAVLEEEILDMVIGMMAKDGAAVDATLRSSRVHRVRGADAQRRRTGPVEHVTVNKHREYTSDVITSRALATTHFVGSAPWNTLDAAPDTALLDLLHDNLHKYVLRHVVKGTVPAYFARLVLIDTLSVCLQVVQAPAAYGDSRGPATRAAGEGSGKDEADAAQQCHVFVLYEGPMSPASREMRRFCEQTIQSLPFEAVTPHPSAYHHHHSGGESGAVSGRPCFRLEHWVTRKKLWAVSAALTAALRHVEHLVNDQYAPFRSAMQASQQRGPTDSSQPDPECPYFVCEGPLFGLLPMSRSGGAHQSSRATDSSGGGGGPASSAHEPRAAGKAESAAQDILLAKRARLVGHRFDLDPDSFFGLTQDQVESLAFAASSISLEVLEDGLGVVGSSSSAGGGGGEGDVDDDASMNAMQRNRRRRDLVDDAVAETVVELLADPSIREAIKRRSMAKVEAVTAPESSKGTRADVSASVSDRGPDSTEQERNARRMKLAQARADHMIKILREEMRLE